MTKKQNQKNTPKLRTSGHARKKLPPPSAFLTQWFGSFILSRQRGVELSRRDEAQLDINYPDSLLTEERLGNRGVRAGDRAPDAVVVDLASLTPTTLFKIIYAGDWTLLAFDSAKSGLRTAVREMNKISRLYRYVFVSRFL